MRITIASTTQDVTSVYACRGKYRIHYRVVDEYDGDTLSGRNTRTSARPLSLGELEAFFNGAFLAVIGTSGSGNSSLIRAGMLPALAIGWTGDVSDWCIAVMRSGERAMRRLAEARLKPGAVGGELAGAGAAPEMR